MTQRIPCPTGNGAAVRGTARPIPDAASKALARLLTGISEPTFVLDDEGRFAGASESLLTQLGMRDQELIGRRLSEILDDDGRAGGGGEGPVRLKLRDDSTALSYLRMSNVDVGKSGRHFRVGILGAAVDGGGADDHGVTAAAGAAVVQREQLRQVFNGKLQDRFATGIEPHVAMAGRIEVICLDDLKASLGDEWQRLRDRTMAMARGILDRRLSPDDVFAETEDDSFVVCFATLSATQARFKSDQIAREIRARLLGEESRPFKVEAQVEEVAFSRREVTGSADLLTTLVAQLDEAREARSQYLQATSDQLVKSARLVLSPMTAADPYAPQLALAGVGGESMSLLSQILGTDGEAKAIFDLDSVVLTLAIKHLFSDRVARSLTLIVPVHYRTLAERRYLNDYLTLSDRMDGAIRKRICFELREVPRDAPASRLQDMFGCLSPYSARRLMHVDSPTPPLGEISRYRLAMVALSARKEHAQNNTASRAFATFVGLLHGQGCQVLVRGVTGRRAAAWYFEHGVDYLSLANGRSATEERSG